jgi:hypothetical protein
VLRPPSCTLVAQGMARRSWRKNPAPADPNLDCKPSGIRIWRGTRARSALLPSQHPCHDAGRATGLGGGCERHPHGTALLGWSRLASL